MIAVEEYLILIAAVTLAASYVQGVTGFGFGIVAMIFLTKFLPYTEANAISSILGPATAAVIIVSSYRKIHWRNLIFPLIGSFAANYFAVAFAKTAENDLLILLLGIALFVLSIYFFFYSDKIKIRACWHTGLTAGAISGVMSGLFAIGGPPVVVYYMQSEEDTDGYLATITAFFVLSGAVSILFKANAGFITQNVWYGTAVGLAAMIVGSLLGKKTRNSVKPKVIKKTVYGFMAVSGLINVITSII